MKIQVDRPIPNKVYFKIGEVADIAQVEPYVLRYWEGEFNFRLSKSKNNQRLYQRKDVDYILLVRKLLYQDRFTIAGAKIKIKEIRQKQREKQLSLVYESSESLKKEIAIKKQEKQVSYVESLYDLRKELKSLLNDLR